MVKIYGVRLEHRSGVGGSGVGGNGVGGNGVGGNGVGGSGVGGPRGPGVGEADPASPLVYIYTRGHSVNCFAGNMLAV